MSCKDCEELNVEYRVASPSDLRNAIAVARDSIKAGTIQEIPSQSIAFGGNASFQDIANGGAWDDFVCFDFKCSHCGQRFQLSAETYHGSGGAWRPITGGGAHAL